MRVLPYYLSIGMPSEEFWRGDSTLVKAYQKAEELRKDRKNQELWWQGMYIYDALCAASPLFRAFGKKGAKAAPYAKEPYDIHPKKKAKKEKASPEKQQMLKMKSIMQAFMMNTNKSKKKEGTSDNAGRNDH